MKRWSSILLIPVAAGTTAAVLFLVQGGFGAGHGRFDQALTVLGEPSIRLFELLPVWPGDFVAIVIGPAAMNCVLWLILLAIVRRLAGMRRN